MTPKKTNLYRYDPDDLVVVGLDTDDDETHPLYDPSVNDTLDGESIAHADEHGITDAVTAVRKNKQALVVCGRRRTRTAREVNKLRKARGEEPLLLNVVFVASPPKGMDGSVYLMTLMIRENLLRRNRTPIEKGRYAQRLLDTLIASGMDLKDARVDVAERMGVTVQSIKDWTKVLGMAPEVVQAVNDGKISAHKALTTFRKVGAEKQAEKLDTLLDGLETAAEASGGETKKRPPAKRNMNKQYAKFMARLDEDSRAELELDEIFWLGMAYAYGKATPTDVRSAKVAGFQKALNRAKKALGED